MENFQYKREQLKADYKAKMAALDHWEKVCKEFKKKQQKQADSFIMEFPQANNCDDYNKVERYANEFGFTIAKEENSLLTTTYIFKRKE